MGWGGGGEITTPLGFQVSAWLESGGGGKITPVSFQVSAWPLGVGVELRLQHLQFLG